MPGTTRYSATFDRTYEEEAKPSSPPNARRSRSQSWQANSGHDGRQYTPFASRSPAPRSSSTDNNLSNGTEFIPTRTAKTSVKAHNNPFQFVKVGTCPLYKKAEEQLKKAKETKKPDVLKEEEEEWQTNLDSWKSRRRKMSEDVFRRQEELKLLELEEQIAQVSNKKTKTFSEMVESRATRGRALSLCLLTSPLEFQNWEFENKAHKSGSCSFTDESGENSIVNSEDEGVSVRGRHEENSINENAVNHRTNGDAHIEQNGTALDKQNGNCNKLSNNVQLKTKENSYIDSGLESISSSHRAGDTPDSGSDFSQDSNSSIDCDSPRTGVNVLEEFSSKSSQISEGHEIRIILKLDEKGQDFGFTFLGGKDEGQVIIASILEGSKAESSGIHLGDRIIMIDGCDVNSKKHIEIAALIQKGREKNQMSLLLWRHTKTTNGTNGFIAEAKHNKVITDENFNAKSYEKSIESENEMFVDDFEELKRQSELLANKKSVAANAQANGNKHSNKDVISLKTSSESSTAPIPKINTSNSAVEEPNKNEEKTEINSENQKKNIIKVKRVRRKGVYALNVDSNQISQDGNSTNTLFPLSPVTELPSPADETKTMSSTLSSNSTSPVSSNITLPVSISQNGFPDEGKQKNAENIKSNIPVSKENNSVIPTSANTENSKSATLQTGSKNVENKIQLNTENETEIANSPTLSSKNKDSQDEKSKSQPTPKKIKASKLKKGITSENTSAASECTNELTSVTQCEDVTSEIVIQEKSSSESKSSHLENKQLPIKNDKNLTALKSMDNITEKTSCGTSTNSTLNEIYSTKEQSPSIVEKQEKVDSKNEIAVSPLKEESNISLNGIANVPQETKQSPKDEISIPGPSTNKVRDLTLKFGVKKPSMSSESSIPSKNAKALKSPESEKTKPGVVEKKESTKAKENCVEQNLIGSPVALSSVPNSFDSSSKNTSLSNKDKQIKIAVKDKIIVASSKMSANSQKVNTPAKLNEESKISNDSLNVVFQSQPKNMGSENITNNKNFENNNNRTAISTDLVTDVPPVDKIAEEMEKLILEQLEEEERAKELSTGKVLVESSPEHLLTAPPRLAEPPKEKPPPPPSTESPKDSSLKRVNSTKRIKKEIYKRRSNFLGIENADESIICSESSVPPPPALEEILKAEMELDRQTRLRIENEATERLTLEEKEIMQKEREIIESLESEERRKMYMNGTEECNNVYMSNSTNDAVCEQGHIESLKCEKKRIDTELQLSEEQQQILIEEKQLKEREEFIRQQEAAISTASLSDSSLSVSANTANNLKKPALSSVPTKVQSNGLLLGTNGDGIGLALSSSTEVSMNETSKGGKKIKASEKPAVPPKPLKKKEAIRKERERLRQEQEALQREREEHRRKLMLEQEELMKQQKNHAPDAPASRLGPHPPQIQPSFPPQLTTTMNATPNARENASFPSRSHHGTSNTAAGSLNAVELMGPPVVRQNVRPAPRKAAQNEAWGQQKMPSVRKQNHESLPESRYNQNHWLIQEAEMRRIAELKERQRTTQTPCTQTHLAEDDVCSNPPRVPVISPTHNPHLNYPVQEKVWNYGQSNMPLKKYPPPVVKEPPLHTIYPRETVPQQPPTKPSRVVPSERQEQMLSVSGRKRCSHCNEELGRGAAMIIESLQLYYHIHCFQCCVCQAQLGNGSCGTDVRVRNNKLHCHNCYSNDEAGLKFSQV